MSNKPTFVRFFISNWMSGVRKLSAIERGVYISLVMEMYDNAGPIADDRNDLAASCKVSRKALDRIIEKLLDLGKITSENGTLFNEKCAKELNFVREKSEKNRENAHARWTKTVKNQPVSEKSVMRPHSGGNAIPEDTSQKLDLGESPSDSRPASDAEEAFELFRQAAKRSGWSVPRRSKSDKDRKKAIVARLKDDGLDGWKAALTRAERSSFLTEASWYGLDWFCKQANFRKILEGNYDDRPPRGFETVGGESVGTSGQQVGLGSGSGRGTSRQAASSQNGFGGSFAAGAQRAYGRRQNSNAVPDGSQWGEASDAEPCGGGNVYNAQAIGGNRYE